MFFTFIYGWFWGHLEKLICFKAAKTGPNIMERLSSSRQRGKAWYLLPPITLFTLCMWNTCIRLVLLFHCKGWRILFRCNLSLFTLWFREIWSGGFVMFCSIYGRLWTEKAISTDIFLCHASTQHLNSIMIRTGWIIPLCNSFLPYKTRAAWIEGEKIQPFHWKQN